MKKEVLLNEDAMRYLEENVVEHVITHEVKVLIPQKLKDKDEDDAEFQEWVETMSKEAEEYVNAESPETEWEFDTDLEGRDVIVFKVVDYRWI